MSSSQAPTPWELARFADLTEQLLRLGEIPHRWDGSRWQCLVCGQLSPDPCRCRCHGELVPA